MSRHLLFLDQGRAVRDAAMGHIRVQHALDAGQLLGQLDRILEQMPDNLKEAFILFELEDMSVPQIAELLAIPTGTVASRLRRARAPPASPAFAATGVS